MAVPLAFLLIVLVVVLGPEAPLVLLCGPPLSLGSPVAHGYVCFLECHAVLFLVFSKQNKTQSPINTVAI